MLHPQTLVVATTFLFGALACFLAFFFRTRKTYPGFAAWTAGISCLAAGYVLLMLRGVGPDWVSILVANYLLMTAMTLMFDGITRFGGQKWRLGINGIFHAAVAGCVALLAYFTYVDADINARVVVVNTFRFVSHTACFIAVLLTEPRQDRGTHRLLAALFLGSAALGAIRAVFALQASPLAHLYDDPAFRLFMLIDLGLITLIAFCLPLLTLMRVEQELERERSAAERASWTDKLTGLWNRTRFESEVGRRLREADRFGDDLSLLMIDIDHFKSVNDRFGHLVGDEVLREVAVRASGSFRSSDLLCRWGGEEFMAVLRAPADAAAKAAENLRLAIAHPPVPVAGQVTSSIGVAQRRPGEDFSTWVSRADQALYRAKANGRNRVEREENRAGQQPSPLFLRWNPGFATGEPVLDEQHKGLLEKATLVFEKCACNDAETAIGLLRQILHDADRHFRYEEHVLGLKKYPRLTQHIEAHRCLQDRGNRVLKEVCAGTLALSAIVDFVVTDLILGHLAEEDTRYIGALETAA